MYQDGWLHNWSHSIRPAQRWRTKIFRNKWFQTQNEKKKRNQKGQQRAVDFASSESFEIAHLKVPLLTATAQRSSKKGTQQIFALNTTDFTFAEQKPYVYLCAFLQLHFSLIKMRNCFFYAICYSSDSKTLGCLIVGLLLWALGRFWVLFRPPSSCERKAFPKGFKQFHKTNVKTKTLLFKDWSLFCFKGDGEERKREMTLIIFQLNRKINEVSHC